MGAAGVLTPLRLFYIHTHPSALITAEYKMAGVATEQDASEPVGFVKELREDVLDWLKKHHPELAPKTPS